MEIGISKSMSLITVVKVGQLAVVKTGTCSGITYFTPYFLYLIQGISDVGEGELKKIKLELDEKVINDGTVNLEPDFVRRIALNIRKGAKFSIEQEGSQI